LTWMSTVPTSVMVPMRVLPSFTLSPMWNFTSVPPRLLRRLRSCALVGTATSRPSPWVVESGDGQLAAGVPRKLASPMAPIDSVPNRVCVDDDAGHLVYCPREAGRCRRSPECADCVRQSLPAASRSIRDLSDEPTPLVVYNVPGTGTTQLGNAQRVHDAACICLRVDIGHPPAVTSGDCPHGYTCGCSASACAVAAARVPESIVAFMTRFPLHMIPHWAGVSVHCTNPANAPANRRRNAANHRVACTNPQR
jgi:hypothetical protein